MQKETATGVAVSFCSARAENQTAALRRTKRLSRSSPRPVRAIEEGSGTGFGSGFGSSASVVRMPNVKPCQFSGVGTVHEKVENVPMNWIVPCPSLPRRMSPGNCCSVAPLPPQ